MMRLAMFLVRLVPRPARNLLRSPRASARWLRDELRYRSGKLGSWAVRDGWRVRCHPASLESFRVHTRDEEFRGELSAFVAHCTPGMVLLDIGAHYGVFTLAALHFGGPGARSIVVDPSAEALRILRINLRLAGAEARAEVVRAAMGAEEGEVRMLSTGPVGAHFMVGARGERSDAAVVPQRTVDGLVEQMGKVPTHIKIDVEGFEDEVLLGGVRFLQRQRPPVFLELHSQILRERGSSPERVFEILQDCGYMHFERNGEPISRHVAARLDIARLVCLPRAAEAS